MELMTDSNHNAGPREAENETNEGPQSAIAASIAQAAGSIVRAPTSFEVGMVLKK